MSSFENQMTQTSIYFLFASMATYSNINGSNMQAFMVSTYIDQ